MKYFELFNEKFRYFLKKYLTGLTGYTGFKIYLVNPVILSTNIPGKALMGIIILLQRAQRSQR